MKTIAIRLIATFAVLDLVFNPLVSAAFVQLLGFSSFLEPFGLLALMWLVKIMANAWFLSTHFNLAGSSSQSLADLDARQVATLDDRLQRLPRRFGVFYSFSWSVTYGLGFLLINWSHPDLGLDPRALNAALLVVVAVWFGGLAFSFPIASMLTSDVAGELSVRARQEGIVLERPAASLQVRIGMIALALGLGPTIWMMALGYMKQLDAYTEQGALYASLMARNAADEVGTQPGDAVDADSNAGVADSGRSAAGDGDDLRKSSARFELQSGVVEVGPRRSTSAQSWIPEAAEKWLSAQPVTDVSGTWVSAQEQRVVAFHRVDARRRAVIVLDTSSDSPSGFMLSAAIFAIVVGLWAPLCAVTLGRSVSGPLQRLTSSAREIVEQGKQSEMGALPVPRHDEVGVLSQRFNDLIDMMRDLSTAADAIARGDLGITIDRNGELPDAFRRMLDSLRAMVSEIRGASVDLGSAATEIFAATQEQEAAATSQSSAMEEISRTMDSLSESAAHVSDSVKGVFSNAERTLENTDDMVGRIGQLSAQAGRIAEILDVIRDIADRSDLLALNGSLEASRAGEGGQGFALVAAEMRRLAERVTASVQDIKQLVVDIRDAGSTTVMATEESKRLARETTEAARQITFVTQQQRSGTEQVSQSVKSIAEVVTQAVSATSQTRTSAEGLKRQADRLADLVKRFDGADARAG